MYGGDGHGAGGGGGCCCCSFALLSRQPLSEEEEALTGAIYYWPYICKKLPAQMLGLSTKAVNSVNKQQMNCTVVFLRVLLAQAEGSLHSS